MFGLSGSVRTALTGTPVGNPPPAMRVQELPRLVDFQRWAAAASGATDAMYTMLGSTRSKGMSLRLRPLLGTPALTSVQLAPLLPEMNTRPPLATAPRMFWLEWAMLTLR